MSAANDTDEREMRVNHKLINQDTEKTWALIFDAGDEFMSEMLAFAKQQNLTASRFSAIGALSSAKLAFFDTDTKEYIDIPVNEQTEVLTLVGDIALDKGEPKIHAHAVLGKRDGATVGGHVMEANVRPTLEVVLVESPRHLRRTSDEASGLALIDLQASE